MKSLTTLSLNLRGLTSWARRLRTRLLVDNLRDRPDIICFQEHKLRLGKIDCIQREVWSGARWICAPASEGVHSTGNNNVVAGRGGVAMGIHHELVPFIVMEGIVNSSRAVWAGFDHPTWEKLDLHQFMGLMSQAIGQCSGPSWLPLSTLTFIGC